MMPRKSHTQVLVDEILRIVGVTATPEKHKELCDIVRAYRFQQVSAALLRVKELVKKSGNEELSEHIFANLDP